MPEVIAGHVFEQVTWPAYSGVMNSHDISFYIEKKQGEGEIEPKPCFRYSDPCTSNYAICFTNRIMQVCDNLEIVARLNTG